MLLKNLAQHAKKDVAKLKEEISSDMMKKLLTDSSLDIFPVTTPTPLTQHRAISAYVDGKGVSKNLLLNKRATSLIAECGFANQEFRGDVFISRVYDNENDDDGGWRREDFTIA